MAQEREVRGQDRIVLWEKRGNNPRNAIGFLNTATREVYTARGSFSEQNRPANLTVAMLRAGFTPGTVENKTHARRMAAILEGDKSGDYTYYY